MDTFVADGIFVDASPERVFDALLDPADVRVWMDAVDATIESRPGGRFFARRDDGSTVEGRIAICERGRQLAIDGWTWSGDGVTRGPMRVHCVLTPRHGGTWITVRQDGLDCGPDWKAFAQATRQELVRQTVALKRHIEGI